jgi:hypothetical protein
VGATWSHQPIQRTRLERPLTIFDGLLRALQGSLSIRQLGAFFIGIEKRRGTKIARVALARRLLTLANYALRDEGGCRAFPASPHVSFVLRSGALAAGHGLLLKGRPPI